MLPAARADAAHEAEQRSWRSWRSLKQLARMQVRLFLFRLYSHPHLRRSLPSPTLLPSTLSTNSANERSGPIAPRSMSIAAPTAAKTHDVRPTSTSGTLGTCRSIHARSDVRILYFVYILSLTDYSSSSMYNALSA